MPETISTLADLLGDTILLGAEGSDKKGILTTIVYALSDSKGFSPRRKGFLLKNILAREDIGSTGIGSGAAVPHAKATGLDSLLGAFARSASPIEFDAVDGEPVDLFFVLLCPEKGTAGYLEALSAISRGLRDKNFCSFLRAARTEEEILYTLGELHI